MTDNQQTDFDVVISGAGLVGLALAAMLVAIVTMPGEDRAFVYFQF